MSHKNINPQGSKHISHQPLSQDDSQSLPGKYNLEIESTNEINMTEDRFPYCIVWTALPIFTWLIPFIGHTGICQSNGIIQDFGGPYYIAVDNFTFGNALKYVLLDNDNISPVVWDEAVNRAGDEYRKQSHNLITNNCHSHVARVLNILKYKEKQNYTMFHIWWMCLANSSYVNCSSILKIYLPAFIIYGLIVLFIQLGK